MNFLLKNKKVSNAKYLSKMISVINANKKHVNNQQQLNKKEEELKQHEQELNKKEEELNKKEEELNRKEELKQQIPSYKNNRIQTLSEDVLKKIVKPFIVTPQINSNFDNDNNDDIDNTLKPLNGSDLFSLYNIPKNITNILGKTRQVKIAIVIAYSYKNLQADLETYWAFNKLDAICKCPTLKICNRTTITPQLSFLSDGTSQNAWSIEECLDVQMVATINPNADIYVVESNDASIENMFTAVDYAVKVLEADIISMSWGMEEDYEFVNDSLFNLQYNDICYCASSGDNNYVSYPSSSPNCVSVGGTTVITDNESNRISEITWDNAGCGVSVMYDIPNYQISNLKTKQVKRIMPDVSLIANPDSGINICFNGKIVNGVGGTSVSAPIFAGILSLVNQTRINNNQPLLTSIYSNQVANEYNVQTKLYNLLNNKHKYNNCFFDIRNGVDGVYIASSGYDIATGLGSPNVGNIYNYLVSI
uniref:Peptidase S53 domain-containing protein n=1 Tax=viral metagenome TaxID=1070528 RepID=A0A6C0I755_9ZZZZ